MVQRILVTRMNINWLAMLAIALGFMMSACSSNPAGNAANQADSKADSKEVPVTVTDSGCEPGQLSVNAGQTTFVITNKSAKILEWEILEGVMVVEEKENIAPGFVQKLKANLKAGEYVMTCGLRSNPKGKIVVTAAKSGAQSNERRPAQIARAQIEAIAPQTRPH
jgi:iron uptake system component EfeO